MAVADKEGLTTPQPLRDDDEVKPAHAGSVAKSDRKAANDDWLQTVPRSPLRRNVELATSIHTDSPWSPLENLKPPPWHFDASTPTTKRRALALAPGGPTASTSAT